MHFPDFKRFKQQEYTGENRCTACTIVNVLISSMGASLLSIIFTPIVGIVFAFLSLILIYFRGYLVPGTPRFTKRYFPSWILSWFDKEPSKKLDDSKSMRRPEVVLDDAGAVKSCTDSEDLCLTESFHAEWRSYINKMGEIRDEKGNLSDYLNVNTDDISIEKHEAAIVAHLGEQRIGQWESHPALLADIAGARVLNGRYESWGTLPIRNQIRILDGLRIFLESCPACGANVTMSSDTKESCCRTIDVVIMTCTGCGSRLLEVEEGS